MSYTGYTEDIAERTITRDDQRGELRQVLRRENVSASTAWADANLPAYGDESNVVSGVYLRRKTIREIETGVRVELTFQTPDLEPFELWAGIFPTGNAFDPDFRVGRELWSFSSGAQQEHITNVRDPALITHYGEDHGTLIGAHGDTVEGVDVYRPALAVRVTRAFSQLNYNDIHIMRNLTSRVNQSTWFMFQAGEVLCAGIEAAVDPALNLWRVDFSFMVRPNPAAFDVTLLDGTTHTINMTAWDYFWTVRGEVIGYDNTVVQGIRSAHVARVHEPADFSILNLYGHGAAVPV